MEKNYVRPEIDVVELWENDGDLLNMSMPGDPYEYDDFA